MKKILRKTVLISMIITISLIMIGCNDGYQVMNHSLVTNAEISDFISKNGRNDCSTYLKTDKGMYFLEDGDVLKQVQAFYKYKKNNNQKAYISFIYDSNALVNHDKEEYYKIDSIVFMDDSQNEGEKIDKQVASSKPSENSNNYGGITINNSIDTNTTANNGSASN